MPDAAAKYLPNPSTARLKIPPHIIEVHNPTNTKNIAFIGTSAKPNVSIPVAVLCITGKSTIVEVGKNIAASTNIKPTKEATVNIVLLETLPPIEAPINLPTNISNQ